MRWLSLLILPTLVLPMSLPGGTREDRSAEAQRLVDSKQFPAALKIYRALNASDPDVADYWIRRARLEGWTGAWTDAEASYVRIQEKWPENVEAIVGHVYVAIWQERFGEAERLLESAERLAPEDVGVLAVRVRFFRAQKKAPEAVRALAVLERRYPPNTLKPAWCEKKLRRWKDGGSCRSGTWPIRLSRARSGPEKRLPCGIRWFATRSPFA